jgi:hypothetical protein
MSISCRIARRDVGAVHAEAKAAQRRGIAIESIGGNRMRLSACRFRIGAPQQLLKLR